MGYRFMDDLTKVSCSDTFCFWKVFENLGIVLLKREPEIVFGDDVRGDLPNDFIRVKKFYSYKSPRFSTLKLYYMPQHHRLAELIASFIDSQKLKNCRSGEKSYRDELYDEIHNIFRYNNFEVDVRLYEVTDLKNALDKAFSEASQTHGVVISAITSHPDEFFYWSKFQAFVGGVPVHTFDITRLNAVSNNPKSMRYYIINNVVQLYAKAGGIPWNLAPEVLSDGDLVVGFTFARHGNGFIVGAAFAFNYVGRNMKTYAVALPLDAQQLKTKSLKLDPLVFTNTFGHLMEAVEGDIRKGVAKVRRVYIFKTNPIHPDEVSYIRSYERLRNVEWVLIHYGESSFRKRFYLMHGGKVYALRNIMLVDTERNRITIVPRGRLCLFVGNQMKCLVKEVYSRSTPRPVDMTMAFSERYADIKDTLTKLVEVSRVALGLTKMDWEAATNWPKRPIVLKYARRLAHMIKVVAPQLTKPYGYVRDIRYLM